LTDAQRVAQQHGGTVIVDSKPAARGPNPPDDPQYYKQPFLTRISLCLPQAVN
jgi:hypothetical protein